MKSANDMRKNKALYIDWNALQDGYDDTPVLRALTARQYTALIAVSEYFAWRTRWLNPPDAETLDLFAGEIRWRLMQDIEICALMIACITDDDDVRNALNQWFVDQITNGGDVYNSIQQVYQQNVGGQPMPETIAERNILPPNPGCDIDKLFGSIYYTIDQMNQNNIDAFEATEVITNVTERAKLLIGAIPVFETLPVDEFIDYVQTIWTDDLFETYVANDTEGYRDQIKCDLRCIAIANGCELTIGDMFRYFVERIAGDPQNDLIQLIAYLATGTWIGTQVNDIFFALQLIVMYYGNQFFQYIGIKTYATMLAIGAREPNSTWELICADCPEFWEQVFDFEIDDYDFVAPYGTYEPGIGFVSGNIEAGLYYKAISISRAVETEINEFIAEYDMFDVNGVPQADRIFVDSDIMDNWLDTATNADGIGRMLEWVGDARAITSFGFTAAASAQAGSFATDGQVIAKKITLRGYGLNPFV